MVPATFLTDADGNMVVATAASSPAAERWSTWIPVKVNGSATILTGSYGTTSNMEGIPITQISPSGKTAWLDYVPVAAVEDADSNAWNVSATGFIPIIGTYT